MSVETLVAFECLASSHQAGEGEIEARVRGRQRCREPDASAGDARVDELANNVGRALERRSA
ncbi:MAG: hypothetical protein HY553_02630 [Elusimicrobia bacterium]|nr:hypothetical protein [Elusimicrobiota bacterium]